MRDVLSQRRSRACPGHLDTEKRGASKDRDHRHKAGDDECENMHVTKKEAR
ncbi:hypothetical protein [Microvirga mediterraneensis]|uniref:Uncharacterized protein n=1 Tax=Microvirga mediterraneensis TaxID=2754695 RepID=A0A838BRG9_9HYPH|nr:hypothetical protein [Microvirga mediterraneensis]MBA1157981.1 hypothetical protein [Microvirga mediterraneensis]